MKKYIVGSALLIVIVVLVLAAGRHKITNVPKLASQGTYIALGDSVAAGVGLKYDSDSSACDRTNQAYSNIVASHLSYTLSNIACSGTTLTEGILAKQNVNNLLVTPQLQQLLARPKPKLITITIGANDAKWTEVFKKCYLSECGSAEDTAAVQTSLTAVTTNLKMVLIQIQQHYNKSIPMVIITGYHQVFPATIGAACSDLTGINTSELNWGRQLQTRINQALQATTDGNLAKFVPINFSGHELCTSNPWVQGLSDNQPYHPTAAGQAAFANQIISAIKVIK